MINSYNIKIDSSSSYSKHAQIFENMRVDIEAGRLLEGTQLPSINEFSKSHNVARDTIEKAYNLLKKEGYVVSSPGKGIYVSNGRQKNLKILMILNKMSSYKKVVYESFINTVGENAKVDLQIHHYDLNLFKDIVRENRGKYHYYVVMPHFTHDTQKDDYINVLKEFPSKSLVILDK